MQKWSIQALQLPLKYVWKISRGQSDIKTNYIINLEDQGVKGLSEVALCPRFGDTEELILSKFEEFSDQCNTPLQSLEDLIDLLDPVDLPCSLRAGIEMAYIQFLSNLSGKSICQLLGLKEVNAVSTSYSIPIMEPGKIKHFIQEHNLSRFKTLKIKVNKENAFDLVEEVANSFFGQLAVDVNEDWNNPDDVIRFMEKVTKRPILFIEQPMPAHFFDEYLYLKNASLLPVFADESLTSHNVTTEIQERFHGVNIKLMKSGGYIRALKQIRDAKSMGLQTMIGCMIESSLGISGALNLSPLVDFVDLDGALFLKRDPFNLIFEENGKIGLSSLH